VQPIGTAALQSRVMSELGTALDGIVSAYWSHATSELQLELIRGSARNLSLHAALDVAKAEGAASKAESTNWGEMLRATHEQLATANAKVVDSQAELGRTQAALGETRARLQRTWAAANNEIAGQKEARRVEAE